MCGGRFAVASGIAVLAVAAAVVPPAFAADPGRMSQTRVLPSGSSGAFGERMGALWDGIVGDSPRAASAAFFPRTAYLQVKAIPSAGSDYSDRLLANFAADIRAAHRLVSAGGPARLLHVVVPRQWAWIAPGACYNRVGYWHAPGARLVYSQQGRVRSFGIYSLISWRGQWYVVHLGVWNEPGVIAFLALGVGAYGPAGGC